MDMDDIKDGLADKFAGAYIVIGVIFTILCAIAGGIFGAVWGCGIGFVNFCRAVWRVFSERTQEVPE